MLWAGAVAGLAFGGYALAPTVKTMMETVSTDDAYVNGHVTYVAPRVAGQVSRVLVDDNDRVKQGGPAGPARQGAVPGPGRPQEGGRGQRGGRRGRPREAQVRGILAQARSQRWKLQRAIEDVDDKVAQLKARVAALRSKEATLDRARADLARAEQLFSRGAIAREEFDQRREAVRTAEAAVKQALEEVHETRVALGLAPHPEGKDLTDVPADLNQTFSGVREALADAAPEHDAGRLPARLRRPTRPGRPSTSSPGATRRGTSTASWSGWSRRPPPSGRPRPSSLQARRDLAQAELNLRYCDVVSEIDGVVTRRNVNPGNNVSGGPEPDGRPLAHRDLDRRQLQGDAARRPAHRPAGAVRGRHVRQPAGVRGPHHRLHHGDRPDPRPCCRRRTPRATS